MTVSKPKSGLSPQKKTQLLLEEAASELEAGNSEKTQNLLKQAESIPHHLPENYFAGGILYTKLGKTEKAILLLEKAVEIRPAYAPYRLTLGAQYLGLRRVKDAIKAFEKATFLEPGSIKPFFSLALANFATGRSKPGKRAFKTFFKNLLVGVIRKTAFLFDLLGGLGKGAMLGLFQKDRPLEASLVLERASVLRKFNNSEKALRLLKSAWEKEPSFPALGIFLGRLYLSREMGAFARDTALALLERFPDELKGYLFFTEVSLFQGRTLEALETLEKIPEKHHKNPDFLLARAKTLYRDNQAARALPWFEKAALSFAKNADFHHSYGRALASLGKMEKAEAEFKKALKADKNFGLAYVALAKMGKVPIQGDLFRKLLKLASNPYLSQKKRCKLNFGAGFALDKAREHETAFSRFKTANDLRDVSFSKENQREKTQKLTEVFTKKFIDKLKASGSESQRPIFIVGMPRSGTTLTEQILAAHPKVFGAGEREIVRVLVQDFQQRFEDREPVWPESAKNLKKKDLQEMTRKYLEDITRVAGDAERVTDKMPGNFWEIGLISVLFPRAKIIHCRRDALATCLSNYFQAYFTYHPYSFRLDNLGTYYNEYRKIMRHWTKVLPGRIFDFDYEKTVSDPKKQIRNLLKFCDLDWHDNCLNFHQAETTVQTSSFAQVRQPIYKTSARKWENYEAHLGPLIKALDQIN